MFEAEIKFVTTQPVTLAHGATVTETRYHDIYFDSSDGTLYASGRELRLRTHGDRTTLTFKQPPFDTATASKEETETDVTDRDAMRALLGTLGYVERMAFTKTCRLTADAAQGLALTITVVTVDFDPRTFVEIEHLAATRDAALAALPVIRDHAASLGLVAECREAYTDLFEVATQSP